MKTLEAHEEHESLGARFSDWNGFEVVSRYDPIGVDCEYQALWESVGVLDLSFRGRVCLTGGDRVRFLHGQVTNDVQRLQFGEGCLAALVSAKGRFESELTVYALREELLLDFEPGLTSSILERFERFIIADDVQAVDVSPHYGLFSVQGPGARSAVSAMFGWAGGVDSAPKESCFVTVPNEAGEIYVMNRGRVRAGGFDVYVPLQVFGEYWRRSVGEARKLGGVPCGMEVAERVRIESGIPRFGADLDGTNLAPEAGDAWVARGISYAKGCYIGQEVIARIRTYGQVVRALRGLRVRGDDSVTLARGDVLLFGGKEVGKITSATFSPRLGGHVALGMVRKECNAIGTQLAVRTGGKDVPVEVVALPFT